ncbi:MAG: TetR/AcrR family transcriptional regulator [Bacilli bacterium]|nr:TetR/AcrR family transcriptional regulator [Bacilli bacterium]
MTKKEEIILSTLDLASHYGLKSLSMSQIAESVGIKKPSLYNHFDSKESLIKEMYNYIREKSKENLSNSSINDEEYMKNKSAYEILSGYVQNYKNLVTNEKMFNFYKVIYSERTTNKEACEIIVEETNKMIEATKMLFKYLKESKKLDIDNIDISSISFAMTIHSLIDYELDQKMTGQKSDKDLIDNYIKWFCKEK